MKQPAPNKPSKGRYARVYFSPEFLAEAARHFLLPEMCAACVLHTKALKPVGAVRIISHTSPIDPARLYDLPALARSQKAGTNRLGSRREDA